MVKRGRPSLNLTPEERIQRRRLQLVASQRKRRAQKRLAVQLPKTGPEPDAEPDIDAVALPPRPDEAALCRYYDAVFLGEDEAATLATANPNAATRTTTTRTSPKMTSTETAANAPLSAAVARYRASLSQTSKPRIDTHAPSSRLEGPSIWADDASAESGKSSTDQAMFASEHLAYSTMPSLGSALASMVPHGSDLDMSHLLGRSATSSNRIPTAKEPDNVFLPGRFSTTASEWMPTNSNETPYSHRHLKPYHRRPPSPSSQDSGSALTSVEAVDLSAPWAGAKQAIPMGF